MNILAVIPCRFNSSRFPGKPLVKIKNKSLIEHVYRGVSASKKLAKVIIATEDERILNEAKSFGAEVVMTRKDHPTGTDRVCEVVERETDYNYILNIQGDEPLVDADCVDLLIEPFIQKADAYMSSLCAEITSINDIENPNIVKVVRDINNKALYFSRYPIPFNRDVSAGIRYYKHIGLYGFTREFLFKFKDWEQSSLEKLESLEQLRVLERGYPIYVNEIKKATVDVNRPEDLIKAESLL